MFTISELKWSKRTLTEAEVEVGDREVVSIRSTLVFSLIDCFLTVFVLIWMLGVIDISKKMQRWSDRAASIAVTNDDLKLNLVYVATDLANTWWKLIHLNSAFKTGFQ